MVGDSGTSKNGNTYYYYTCNDFINEVADKCMEYQTKEQDNSVLNALEARRKELNKSIKN